MTTRQQIAAIEERADGTVAAMCAAALEGDPVAEAGIERLMQEAAERNATLAALIRCRDELARALRGRRDMVAGCAALQAADAAIGEEVFAAEARRRGEL